MNRQKRIIILSLVLIAVVATFMLKGNGKQDSNIEEQADLPVILDLSAET